MVAVGLGADWVYVSACLFGINVTVGRSVLADSCTFVRGGGGNICVGCVGSGIGMAGALDAAGLDAAGLDLDL